MTKMEALHLSPPPTDEVGGQPDLAEASEAQTRRPFGLSDTEYAELEEDDKVFVTYFSARMREGFEKATELGVFIAAEVGLDAQKDSKRVGDINRKFRENLEYAYVDRTDNRFRLLPTKKGMEYAERKFGVKRLGRTAVEASQE